MIVFLQLETGEVRIFATASPRLALLRAIRWTPSTVKLLGVRSSKRERPLLRRLHRRFKAFRITRDWYTKDVAKHVETEGKPSAEGLLDVQEAARRLGVAVVTLRRYVRVGFPHVRVGRQLRFLADDLV